MLKTPLSVLFQKKIKIKTIEFYRIKPFNLFKLLQPVKYCENLQVKKPIQKRKNDNLSLKNFIQLGKAVH